MDSRRSLGFDSWGRLAARLMKHSTVMENGCIEWTGYAGGRYGRITVNKHPMSSHRLAWSIFVGDIPADLWVLHKCDNPVCINPEHLFLGSPRDNIDDMDRKGRRKTHRLLSTKQVKMIRSNQGARTQNELARLFGVTQTTISDTLRRKTWRGV